MSDDPEPRPYVGGQAVIEGVMMRAPGSMSVAVRRPDGVVAVRQESLEKTWTKRGVWRLPGFRGVATLGESLSLGYRALQYSAEQQQLDGGPPRAAPTSLTALALLLAGAGGGGSPGGSPSGGSARGAMAISILIALGLFIVLPQVAVAALDGWLGLGLDVQSVGFHALVGAFKLAILTGYLVAIAQLEDIRRVFQYHGAEHKTIHAYERGLELTVDNVRPQSTLHPRCGTTFLILVVVVSIVLGSVATPLLLPDGLEGIAAQALTLVIRLALLPLIAALSYELQRFSARHCTTGPLRVFLWPGFLYQRITTREPEDDQMEVAIMAMESALWRREVGDALADEHTFESFDSFKGALGVAEPA